MCFSQPQKDLITNTIKKNDAIRASQAASESAPAGAETTGPSDTQQGLKRRGRRGTIITRGLGLGSSAETSTKTLLGA